MGKVLIIKGADFEKNAISTTIVGTALVVEQGVIDLVPTSGTQGDILPLSNGGTPRRLRAVSNIHLNNGDKITISGLSGLSGNSMILKIDAAIYSVDTASHDNLITTLNGGTTNYYSTGGSSDSVTITISTTGYYRFCFAGQSISTDNINYNNYNPLNYSIK